MNIKPKVFHVIEDDDIVRDATAEMLSLNYVTPAVTYRNGVDFQNRVCAEVLAKPDSKHIFISDYHMPGGNACITVYEALDNLFRTEALNLENCSFIGVSGGGGLNPHDVMIDFKESDARTPWWSKMQITTFKKPFDIYDLFKFIDGFDKPV